MAGVVTISLTLSLMLHISNFFSALADPAKDMV